MAIITKTEYTYICSKGSGMAVEAILMSNSKGGFILAEGGGMKPMETIDQAERYLQDEYHEVMLDRKIDYIITKLERIVQ